MAGTVQVIAANEDDLVFERAFVDAVNGVLVPRAVMGGVLCNIQTEPGPLADGLAFCEPVDPEAAQNWPMYLDVDLGAGEERLWNFTRNPSIVAAARRFEELNRADRLVEGMPL